jgi:serine/threonine-protein kinase
MEEKTLQKFGKYEIIAELGRGGMGVVYKARDPLIGRLVALKTLSSDVLSDPDLLKRFYREAQSAGNLQHPNVVTIYDLGEASGSPYIAMELVEGETLREIIARQSPLPLAQKLSIIRQFCQGLGHAHQHGVTHRDVKPANILVTSDGTAKVVDFGIAHLETTSITKSGVFIGTVLYASPEQVNNMKVDSRSDIFSVGIVIYEFLTYVNPFNGPTVLSMISQVLTKEPAPLRQLAPEIPAELEAIVSRCLQKDPDKRYQTLEEMLLELEPVAESLGQDFAKQIVNRVPELIARRDFSRAREVLLKVLTIDRSDSAAKNLLAEVNSEIRRQEVSTKIADCLHRGQESSQKGDYKAAVQSFEEALRFDSKHEQAQSFLAIARQELERAEAVRTQLVSSKNAYRSGDLTEAEVSLKKVLELDMHNPEAQDLLSQIQNERAEREKHFRLQEGVWQARNLIRQDNYEGALAALAGLQDEFAAEAEIQQLSEEALRKSEALRNEVETVYAFLQANQFREAFKGAGALASRFPGRADVAQLYEAARSQCEAMERRLQEGLWQVRNLLQQCLYEQALDMSVELQKEYASDAGVGQLLEEARQKSDGLRKEVESVKASLHANRLREASARAAALTSKYPGRPDIAQLYETAQSQYEAAESRRELEMSLAKIKSLIKHKNYVAAAELCSMLVQRFPDSSEVLQLAAQAENEKQTEELQRQMVAASQAIQSLISADRYDEAAAQAENALTQFPGNSDLARLLVTARRHLFVATLKSLRALNNSGRFDEAIHQARSSLEKFPGNAELEKLLRAAIESLGMQPSTQPVGATGIFRAQDLCPQPPGDISQPDALPTPPANLSPPPPAAMEQIEPSEGGPEHQAPETGALPGRHRLLIFLGLGSVIVLAVLTVVGVLVFKYIEPQRAGTLVQLEILTSPSGAAVSIDGKLLGRAPLNKAAAAGSHKLEAVLEGYQPAEKSLTLTQGTPANITLELQPLSPSLRVFTDLESGVVQLEGGPAAKLQDGEFAMDQIAPGKHSLRVANNGQVATVDFETAPGTVPVLTQAAASRNLSVIAVSDLGGHAQVFSNSKTLQVGVDNQPLQTVGPHGLTLDNLTPASHEFTFAEGSDQQKKVIAIGGAPALTVYLRSNRNVGTLVVVTGTDGAQVLLNGKPLQRPTRNGQLRISNLEPSQYNVDVTEDGYEKSASQIAQVSKGEETTLTFELKPIVQMAALSIQGGLAGAEVSLDGKPIGTVGPNGTLTASDVVPGEHTLGFRKEGFQPKQLRQQFVAGQMQMVDGNQEPEPKQLLGALLVNVSPPAKVLTLRRQGETSEVAITPGRREFPPGNYTVTARWSSGREQTLPLAIVAGGTIPVDLSLKPIGMEGWRNPKEWSAEGNLYVHKGGGIVLFDPSPTAGTFVFTAPHHKGKPLAWVLNYTDQNNYLLFEIDSKVFVRKEVVGGKARELSRSPSGIGKSEFFSIRIDVAPGSILQQISNGQRPLPLDTWKDSTKDFSRGKFGFVIPKNQTVSISNFGFSPQ